MASILNFRAARVIDRAPVILTSGAQTVAENSPFSVVLTSDQTVIWSKIGGADAAKFTLSGANLSLPAKNYEAPDDADANGTYVVTVQASNGVTGLTASLTISVGVTDVVETAPADLTMISTDKIEVDPTILADTLSVFNDTGNLITVAVTGTAGVLTANIWLMRDMTSSSASHGFTKRELLDYFCLTTAGATDGAQAGAVTFTGYTGANGAGSVTSRTLTVNCDNSVIPPWLFGANTLAQFGGVPLHKYLPGALSAWSIQSQTNAGQFAILADTTSRTEVVTGKTYSYGFYRLVLAPAASSPNGMNTTTGDRGTTQPYGGTPAVVPTPGAAWSVTLTNGSITRTLTGTFVAGQADSAPWPVFDKPTQTRDKPTSQIGYTMRQSALWVRGNTFVLEEGDHYNGQLQPGWTAGFSSTTPTGTAPAGCFASDALLYASPLTPNANMITFRGRTPSVYMDVINIDQRSILTSALGWRWTRIKTSYYYVGDGATSYTSSFQLLDHVHFVNLGRANFTPAADQFTDRVTVTVKGVNASVISCYSRGNINIQGADCQVVGNRFEDTIVLPQTDIANPKVMDTLNLTASTINSNNAVPIATVAFNAWVGRQNVDDLTHCDWLQAQAVTASGNVRGYRFFGNVMAAGARRADGGTSVYRSPANAGKNLPGGAEVVLMTDLSANTVPLWEIGCNLIVENLLHGITLQNPQAGTKIRRNALLDDLAYTNRSSDQGLARIELKSRGTYVGTAHNANLYLENNMYSAAGYSADGSIAVGNATGNLQGDVITTAWQTANLVNPTIGGAFQDIGDIMDAFALKPGYSGPALNTHPFSDPTLCDPRRHVADLATMFA